MKKLKILVLVFIFGTVLAVMQPVLAQRNFDMTQLRITEVKPVEQSVIRSVNEPITYYAVYIDSELIGYLHEYEYFLALLDHVYSTSYREDFPDLSINVANGMRIVEEHTFFKYENKDSDIINVIYSANRFSVEAYKITLDNNEVVYVRDADLFKTALNEYISSVLGPTFDVNMTTDVQPPTGLETRNVRYTKANIIDVSSGYAPVNRLLNTREEIDSYLTYGYDAQENFYLTNEGDTLESISRANNINPVYLRFTNPTLFVEGNLLPTGSRVNLTQPESPIDLAIERYNRTHEIIYSQTVEEIDTTKYVDQVEVVQEGVDGVREVLYLETVRNGIMTDSSEVESKVVEPAVDKLVVKGSKPRPTNSGSVGTFVSGNINHGLNGYAWPTYSTQISSYYGVRWGVFGDFHTGIDIVDPRNRYAPVLASKAGEVVIVSSSGSGYGNLIVIKHDDGWYTRYAHLSSFNVTRGQMVGQGEWIGNIGSTGWSTGPHLHFEINSTANQNGTSINPCNILGC